MTAWRAPSASSATTPCWGERSIHWRAGLPSKLEKWAEENLMKLRNTNKSPAPETKNTHCQHKLRTDRLEKSSSEKQLGVLVGSKVNRNQQCAPAATKASHILGCIGKGNNSQELREMALLLFLAPRRLHLEHCLI